MKTIIYALICVSALLTGCAGLTALHGANETNLVDLVQRTCPTDWPRPLCRHVEMVETAKARFVEDLDNDQFYLAMTKAAVSALDRYTRFQDVEDYQVYQRQQRGDYVGLGIRYTAEGGGLRLTEVFEDSPAEAAGLLQDDLIASVDGRSLGFLDEKEIKDILKTEQTIPMTLQVLRSGSDKALSLTVTPSQVIPAKVKFKLLDHQVGWLRLSSFNQRSLEQMTSSLQQLELQAQSHGSSLSGLILDLRGNSGGSVPVATGVAAMFLSPNVVVYKAQSKALRQKGEFQTIRAHFDFYQMRHMQGVDPLLNLPSWVITIPMMVLVNHKSASATELVASALQDHRRAKIAGSSTFGKGLVQNTRVVNLPELKGDGAITVTEVKYFSPLGREINGFGVNPDVELIDTSLSSDALVFAMRQADYPPMNAVLSKNPELENLRKQRQGERATLRYQYNQGKRALPDDVGLPARKFGTVDDTVLLQAAKLMASSAKP